MRHALKALSGGASRRRRGLRQTAAACSAWLLAAASAGSAAIQQRAPAPPDAVHIPAGLNLGFTSYYDGFGATEPGFAFVGYARHAMLNELTGPNGGPAPGFKNPRVDVDAVVLQGVYTVGKVGAGAIGVTVVEPIINMDSSFETPGVVLRDNGLGFGDTYVGAFYQSKPIVSGGRQVLSWRAELDAIAPTGSFNSKKDLNQGAGFWSLNPYVTTTYLPTPRIEISSRLSYLYNFATSRAPNPPPFPDLPFRSGQAGQVVWLNFAASYELISGFSLGTSGYWLTQITEDRYDGVEVPDSRAAELYVGPGFHWAASKTQVLNANAYLPVSSRNLFQGPQVSLEYVHAF